MVVKTTAPRKNDEESVESVGMEREVFSRGIKVRAQTHTHASVPRERISENFSQEGAGNGGLFIPEGGWPPPYPVGVLPKVRSSLIH